MTDAIERARRAGEAAELIGPAMDTARADYLAALTSLAANEPWETGKISKLAIAMKVIDIAEQQLRALILSGEIDKRDQARAAQIAQIPENRRNILKRMGVNL